MLAGIAPAGLVPVGLVPMGLVPMGLVPTGPPSPRCSTRALAPIRCRFREFAARAPRAPAGSATEAAIAQCAPIARERTAGLSRRPGTRAAGPWGAPAPPVRSSARRSPWRGHPPAAEPMSGTACAPNSDRGVPAAACGAVIRCHKKLRQGDRQQRRPKRRRPVPRLHSGDVTPLIKRVVSGEFTS